MFGYLRPLDAELLVKEHEMYRAIYCGLCRTMRRRVSFFASFSLNYDFVFLALLRAELTEETFHFCQKRCPVHPLKRRNCATLDSKTLKDTALVHLALTYEKMRDDWRDPDTSFGKHLVLSLYYPLIRMRVRRLEKKDAEFREILAHASDACNKLYELEKAGESDVDQLAHVCSEGIARACCVGLSEEKARLMYAAASLAGRLIYLLDACDDLEQDEKKGSFNAFLKAYGSFETARDKLSQINTTLALYARELDHTVNLIARPNRYAGLCQNITQKGIVSAIRRIVLQYDSKEQERNFS